MITRMLLAIIAVSLTWLAIRPHVMPTPAEASRETIAVNLERIGGRFLIDGTIPVKCAR